MGTTWSGMDKLTARLNDLVKLDKAKEVVKLNGAEMQQNAMRFVPVDTGQLKRSITLNIEDNGLTARLRAETNYAAYVEYGTRFTDAQPFIRPAYRIQKILFENDMRKL